MSFEHQAGRTGKRQFERFAQAAQAAKRRNRMDGGAHLEAYHCTYCDGFHIGEARGYKKPNQRKERIE